MRFSLAMPSLAATLLTACAEPTAPPTQTPSTEVLGSISAPALRHNATELPFKGDLEGAVTITPLPLGRGNVHIEATGNATQLGRFTLQVPHIVTFATRVGVGSYTFTAANGDQLFASFTGQAASPPPMVSIIEYATITGGTGRFADATGSFVVERLFDQAAGWTTGTFEGTVSLNAGEAQ
jgi:hypothetical protein